MKHEEKCTARRCSSGCDVAEFLWKLEQPILLVDVRRSEREHERLVALAAGDLPGEVAG